MVKGKDLVKPINFGRKGTKARALVDHYLATHKRGMGFSKIVRDCVVMCLEDSQEFKGWKLKMLKEQRKQLKKQVSEIGKQLYENAELIEKQGGRVEE